MSPTIHAKFSPSGFDGWSNCAAWESDPTGSTYADEGTDAHELGEICLTTGTDARIHLGRVLGKGNTVTDEMAEAVQVYLDHVRAIRGERFVEVRLPITSITGEPDAFGTSDCVILDAAAGILHVIDYKHGRGVRVEAENNGQMRIYGAAALEEFGFLAEIREVQMTIVQPRADNIVTEILSALALDEWSQRVAPATEIRPGTDQCRWCAKKATCPDIRAEITALFDTVPADETASQEELALAMDKADTIEGWIKAVRGEVEKRLLHGQPVTGYKLVQGRRGSRTWKNDDDVADTLKKWGLSVEQRFDLKLISPTTAEKLVKAGTIGPRRWAELQERITQAEGKPTVAPSSDKRPAIAPLDLSDEFAGIENHA
jgi:hypothetical protein